MFRLLLVLTLSLSSFAFAGEHQMIDTLGASKKGQFVALEEYGYRSQNHSYYVNIRVMNVWTKQYVGQTIQVELPAHRPHYLEKARARAKFLANDILKRFDIRS